MTRQNEKTKEEAATRAREAESMRIRVHELKGESDGLKRQHAAARDKFVKANGEANPSDVFRDLLKMDPKAHADTMTDMHSKPENQPIWKDYDFLERPGKELPLAQRSLKQLKDEVIRMKHENKDFAAELDKIQSLLKLQTDIERENRQFHQAERDRLKLLQQSTALKAQEMQKRVDGQQKLLEGMKGKLGIGKRTGSPDQRSRSRGRDDDALSDFSVNSKDSEGAPEENFLDLRVIDGQLDEELISRYMKGLRGTPTSGELVTVVTVDFYDHDTKTSGLAQGYRPQYKSQISFRNKMDSFYVQYLSKNKMRMEVYVNESQKTSVLLGSCEVLLSELVHAETVATGNLPAVFEKHLNILPSPGVAGELPGSVQSLGTLRIKMRMRKPIQEAARFFEAQG